MSGLADLKYAFIFTQLAPVLISLSFLRREIAQYNDHVSDDQSGPLPSKITLMSVR